MFSATFPVLSFFLFFFFFFFFFFLSYLPPSFPVLFPIPVPIQMPVGIVQKKVIILAIIKKIIISTQFAICFYRKKREIKKNIKILKQKNTNHKIFFLGSGEQIFQRRTRTGSRCTATTTTTHPIHTPVSAPTRRRHRHRCLLHSARRGHLRYRR